MSNRLKAYVRRTMLAAARDYAPGSRRTKESTRAAFSDAMRGTDSGWWTDLIYTAPMLAMAHRYRRDIATALAEYRDGTGEPYSYRGYMTGETEADAAGIAGALLGGPYSFEAYKGEVDGGADDLSLLGLRFAVEWYAGEIANELCPDL